MYEFTPEQAKILADKYNEMFNENIKEIKEKQLT